jgi:hypothetical protein
MTPDPTAAAELEAHLAEVEARLADLGLALRDRDLPGIDQHASDLHASLARAVDHFAHAARSGPVPPALRQRLALTGGLVAAQRESLARATSALDRAIDVLLPREPANVYGANGSIHRPRLGGVLSA